MTHRERLLTALDHRTPDRVPMDLGSSRVTSVSKVFYEQLKAHFGIERPTRIIDRIMQTAAIDEEILTALDVDCRGVLPGAPDNPPDRDGPGNRWIDAWGVTRRLSPNGYYYELENSPLSGSITMGDATTFAVPDATDEGLTRGIAEQAKRLREETDYAIVGHSPGGWIHISQYLRGFEDWYMDFALQPDVVVAIMKRARDATLEAAKRFLGEVGPYLDVVVTGDDIGAQNGLQISPDMYREFIWPLQKEQFDAFHAGTDGKVFYHTCGDVTSVLEDIIEMGVNILNPVQVTAGGDAECGGTEGGRRRPPRVLGGRGHDAGAARRDDRGGEGGSGQACGRAGEERRLRAVPGSQRAAGRAGGEPGGDV